MSKKKTQLDRAIDALSADLAAAAVEYEGRREGLIAALTRMKEQQEKAPTRKAKAVHVVLGPVAQD